MVVDTKSKEYFAVKVINRRKLMKRKLDRYKNLYSIIEKEVAILKRMVSLTIVGVIHAPVSRLMFERRIRTSSDCMR